MYTELRRIYSGNSITLNLEQREFGLIGNLIKNIRGKVSNKIERSIIKDFERRSSVLDSIRSRKLVNSNSEKEISDIARRKYKAEIINTNDPYLVDNNLNRVSSLSDIIKTAESSGVDKKYIEELKKNNYYILHPSKSGTENLAHEIGHIQNKEDKNLIKNTIRKLADKYPTDKRDPSTILKDSGVGLSIKNYIKGNILLQEERNANKNAIKLLKKSGYNPDKIKDSKESLKKNLMTYKYDRNIRSKIPLMNKVQDPSERFKGDLINYYKDIVKGKYKNK